MMFNHSLTEIFTKLCEAVGRTYQSHEPYMFYKDISIEQGLGSAVDDTFYYGQIVGDGFIIKVQPLAVLEYMQSPVNVYPTNYGVYFFKYMYGCQAGSKFAFTGYKINCVPL